jgi:hypothetical protein
MAVYYADASALAKRYLSRTDRRDHAPRAWWRTDSGGRYHCRCSRDILLRTSYRFLTKQQSVR